MAGVLEQGVVGVKRHWSFRHGRAFIAFSHAFGVSDIPRSLVMAASILQ